MSPRQLPQGIALLMLLGHLRRHNVALPALADPGLAGRERLRFLRSALLATRIKPHALFDPAWYRWLNPDTEKVPALLHYVIYGHREGRSTHPLVDPEWLIRTRPEIGAVLGETVLLEALNPFLEGRIRGSGSLQSIQSTENFDSNWYLREHPDVLRDWARVPRAVDLDLARSPLAFWTHRGRAMGLPPSPLPVKVDQAWSTSDASIRALLAESYGFDAFRLEAMPPFEGLTFRSATAFAEDRLILELSRGLAHHPEALEWLGDPDIGRKSRNFSIYPPNVLLTTPGSGAVLAEPVVHFLHECSSNYFHAMVAVAARLVNYLEQSQHQNATALLDNSLPESVKELVRMLLPENWKMWTMNHGSAVSAPELIYPAETAKVVDRYRGEHRAGEIYLNQSSLEALIARIEQFSTHIPAANRPIGEKLFVPRTSHYRRLVNSAEVESLLVSQGFRVYTPMGSVFDQRNIFKSAQVVVAPTGAALTNILFMPRGSLAVVLSSVHESVALSCWDAVAKASGVHVLHVRGPYVMPRNAFRELEWYHDYSVDAQGVLRAIGR